MIKFVPAAIITMGQIQTCPLLSALALRAGDYHAECVRPSRVSNYR